MTSKSGAKPKLSCIVAIHKSTKTFISLIHTSHIRVILTAQKHRNLSMKWKLKVKNGNRTKSRKDRLYWLCIQWGDNIPKKAALARVSNKIKEKELADLVPLTVLLIHKRQWILTK